MAIVLVVLFLVLFLNVAYEALVAPQLRLYIRVRLLSLIEDLRQLRNRIGIDIEKTSFLNIEDSLFAALSYLPETGVHLFFTKNRSFGKNQSLRALAEKRNHRLDYDQIEEFRRIREQSVRLFRNAFIVNSAVAILYGIVLTLLLSPILVPLAISFALFGNSQL